MKLRTLLLASAVALAIPAAASAQQSTISEGFYVGAQTGASWLNSLDLSGPTATNSAGFKEDWTGLLEAGYRMGNGLRFGLEFSYSDHTVGTITGPGRAGGEGDLNAYTYMATVAYEFETNAPIRPYLGIGAGWVSVEHDGVGPVFTPTQFINDKDRAFAYQASAGLIWSAAPNIDVTLGYRFIDSRPLNYETTTGARVRHDYQNHSVLAGIRYVFGTAPAAPPPPPPAVQPVAQPAPAPAPQPAPAQAQPVTRNFTVFFDWDSAQLTPDAREVLNNVLENARQGSVTQIEVIGHTDTSGSADYNQRLSLRRAESIREYLVSQGMRGNQIDIAGRGETELLVPTPDGVREPSNRRGVIIFP